MGLLAFGIIFDNSTPVFLSGESVSGKVVVKLNEPKKMARLKVELVGKGEVHWKETRRVTRGSGDNRRTETVTDHYNASERYTNQEAIVFPGPSLGEGVHLFKFNFNLPSNLPSSFESGPGHVRYYVKATIVRNWKWDHDVKEHITINSVLDLNMLSSALKPGHSHDFKNLCCLCCKSGPISATVTTNRTGYVPGEQIGFTAEVDNKSTRAMDSSFLSLIETVTYHTSRKNKTETRTVAEIRRGRIEPGDQDMWEDVKMRVPALPPTNLGGNCDIISVQYTLEFHVDPSGPSFDLVVSLPIVIGTIPPRQYIPSLAPPVLPSPAPAPAPPSYQGGTDPPPYQGGKEPPPYEPPSMKPSAPPTIIPSAPPAPNTAWLPSAPPPQMFSNYPDLPPPTYAESVFGVTDVRGEDDANTTGDFQFVPRYPMYNTHY